MQIKRGMKFNKAGAIYTVNKKLPDNFYEVQSSDQKPFIMHKDAIEYYVERFLDQSESLKQY